jgi:hypothetical protein
MAGLGLQIGVAKAESDQGRGVEILSRASKSYEAGAYSDAEQLIDSAFKAGLTGELAARAILLRGEINEGSGALAKALQDYSNALWMETLPPADRKKASEGKERVLAAMGLSSPPPASGQAGAQVVAASAPAQSTSSSNGVLGFITGVFGGSESAPAPPAAAPSTPPPAPASAQPTPAAAPQTTPTQATAKPVKVAHAKPAAAPQASAQPTSALSVAAAPGDILIVFGSASSEASGRSAAKTIKAQLSDILIHRDLDVTPGAGGKFQIQAGPYKSKSSAAALCSAIKERGIQCRVTP